jgi:enoyl-CoA hydratase/carnithine racemase
MSAIEVARDGAITTLTLNRPDRLNAVTQELYEQLIAALVEAGDDRSVRAVVLTGAGRAFCVGADLKGHGEVERDDSQRRRYIDLGQRAASAIFDCSKPVIAAVNGHAVGAGLELALACDLSVVNREAKLRLPELALGTFVGGGTTVTLVERVGMAKARELLLLARFFSGADAAEWGLCNAACSPDEVTDRARGLAEEAAKQAPVSVALAKRALRRARDLDLRAVLDQEAESLLTCMKTEDWREGIAAFAERREPRFRGE